MVREIGRDVGLDVVPSETPEDPGHALIVPPERLSQSPALRKRLRRACALLDPGELEADSD